MSLKDKFIETALRCNDEYGTAYDFEEDMYMICCECQEPLYFMDFNTMVDWEDACDDFAYEFSDKMIWSFCPVCGTEF